MQAADAEFVDLDEGEAGASDGQAADDQATEGEGANRGGSDGESSDGKAADTLGFDGLGSDRLSADCFRADGCHRRARRGQAFVHVFLIPSGPERGPACAGPLSFIAG